MFLQFIKGHTVAQLEARAAAIRKAQATLQGKKEEAIASRQAAIKVMSEEITELERL